VIITSTFLIICIIFIIIVLIRQKKKKNKKRKIFCENEEINNNNNMEGTNREIHQENLDKDVDIEMITIEGGDILPEDTLKNQITIGNTQEFLENDTNINIELNDFNNIFETMTMFID
jgi:predicted membrane protein